jgi:hypothetical protein
MLRTFVNCAIVLKNRLNFFYFQWPKVDQVCIEYLRSYLNCWHNWQLKNRRRSHSLKGSHSMGDGWIFLKTRRDTSFNKDLSNEPNFDRSILLDSAFKRYRPARLDLHKSGIIGKHFKRKSTTICF